MVVETPYPNAPGASGSTQNLQTAIGQGNYTIDDNTDGSGTNFGQTIDDSYVRSLIPGAAPSLTGGGLWTTLADFRDKFHTYLQTFDLDTLKMVQPFVPGATDADFVDVPTASTKILGAFGFHVGLGVDDFNGWLTRVFDAHASNWDIAKQNWDDYLSRVHEANAQDAADRVYNVKNWQTRKDNNDLVLRDWSHVIYAKGTSSDDATTLVGGLPTWWGAHNDNKLIIKERLGLSTTPADMPTDINATITTTNSTVSTNAAWQARKDDNDEIIRDYFHQTYPKGTTSDDATTLVGGLRTWWGAVNDNKLIRKERLGLSVLPTTQQAEIGDSVTLNAASAAAASAAAALSQAVTQDVMNQAVGAQTGITPTAATSSDFYNAQTAIAQSSVVGLIAPAATFGAVGSNASNTAGPTANNISLSGSHTPISTDNALYVVTNSVYAEPKGINSTSVTATVGGVGKAMSLVSSVEVVSSTLPGGLSWVLRQDTWRLSLIPTASPNPISLAAALSAAGWLWMWMQSFSYFGSVVKSATTFATTADSIYNTGGGSLIVTSPATATNRIQLVAAAALLNSNGGTPTGGSQVAKQSGSQTVTTRWYPGTSGLTLGSHASNYHLYVAAADAPAGDSYNAQLSSYSNQSGSIEFGAATLLDISN